MRSTALSKILTCTDQLCVWENMIFIRSSLFSKTSNGEPSGLLRRQPIGLDLSYLSCLGSVHNLIALAKPISVFSGSPCATEFLGLAGDSVQADLKLPDHVYKSGEGHDVASVRLAYSCGKSGHMERVTRTSSSVVAVSKIGNTLPTASRAFAFASPWFAAASAAGSVARSRSVQ